MSNNLFDGLNDIENITTLLEKLEGSSFNYLKVENNDLKIVIGKNGVVESSERREVNQLSSPQENKLAPAISQEVKTTDAKEGIVYIKAVMTGLYYGQPEPGAAPYIKVGDHVEEDSTVGLIEIMKVFSALAAGVSGEITEILVQDGQLVEYGQPLIAVKVK
ncbi:acetyl-CoA carboxylase biotin carboxyl carrier protein [Bacillus paramycoides]|uniref:acetyl-CoA carboxylase biotin carboxyl carrier protein n=1 Tax=Bacillus paramycoides TaxID=2026194 RepID=UPI003D041263